MTSEREGAGSGTYPGAVAQREWVPAPGWPDPPPGFLPTPGWAADPSWPPPPEGHLWWRFDPAALKRRRQKRLALAITGVLIVGGCTAALAVGGPCAFDPPPGDYSGVRVINDLKIPVFVAVCDDTKCNHWSDNNADLQATIDVGRSASITVESCSGDTIGVGTSQKGPLSRCLVAPTVTDGARLPDLHASAATRCPALSR
jgi:hypothetical protein